MTVPFNLIPTNVRTPFFYGEMDASQAAYFSQNKRTLMLGQMLATGVATPNVPTLVTTLGAAMQLFGRGSMLARMFAKYRGIDSAGEVWVLPQLDNPAGVAATGSITVTGPATASGTIPLYVAGQLVQVGVTVGDTAATIAAAIAAVVNAAADLPVTATSAAAVVTLAARHKGLLGNDITVLDCYYGTVAGESLPAGVSLAYVAMSGGSGNPSLTAAVSAMGDEPYEYVVCPYTDSPSLDALRAEFNDSTGRWAYNRLLFGHVYSALRGTVSSLSTFGQTRNDQHATIAGFEADVPNTSAEYAAAYAARNAVYLNANVSRPTQTGSLDGILPARVGKRFLWSERQALLNYGIATSVCVVGVVQIDRAITTYQKNVQGYSDTSYLDSETLFQSAEFMRRMRAAIAKYGRHSAANDGTRFGAGAAVVTPKVIAGELDAEYRRMETDGLVENFALWQKARIVERNANNPNRFDILFAPDYVNQLRIVAAVNQFRLQYPA